MRHHHWTISPENYELCVKELFPMWLKERGGIIVYENHMFDSSSFGGQTFLPARYIAEDNKMHDAPGEYRPHGGLPSFREQKVDHIKLEDFASVDEALKCFVCRAVERIE